MYNATLLIVPSSDLAKHWEKEIDTHADPKQIGRVRLVSLFVHPFTRRVDAYNNITQAHVSNP